jgi:hypothetical protein
MAGEVNAERYRYESYYGGATFWSPRKMREARAREVAQEEAEIAAKAKRKELLLLSRHMSLFLLLLSEKVVRERERAGKLAARDARIEAQNTKKPSTTTGTQTGKRKASSSNPKSKQAKGGAAAVAVSSQGTVRHAVQSNYTKKSRDNRFCCCCNNLIFVVVSMLFCDRPATPIAACTGTVPVTGTGSTSAKHCRLMVANCTRAFSQPQHLSVSRCFAKHNTWVCAMSLWTMQYDTRSLLSSFC